MLKQHGKKWSCMQNWVCLYARPPPIELQMSIFMCCVGYWKVGYSCVVFNLKLFMCCVGYSKRKLLRNPRKSPQSAVSGTPGIKGSAAAQNFLRYLFVKYCTIMWDYNNKILEYIRVLLIYIGFISYLFLKYFRILYSYARFLTVFCLWNI